MTVRADHHISVRVSDLDRSIRFYTEAVGGTLLTEPVVRNGPIIDEVFGQGAEARMCFVGFDSNSVELWQFLNPVTPIPYSDQPRLGIMHFAITIDDVDAAAARVVAGGGKLRFPVKDLGGGDTPARFVYCEDPDGNVFEFLDTDLHGTLARLRARNQGT